MSLKQTSVDLNQSTPEAAPYQCGKALRLQSREITFLRLGALSEFQETKLQQEMSHVQRGSICPMGKSGERKAENSVNGWECAGSHAEKEGPQQGRN